MCNCNKITICTEFDAAQIAGLQVPIASIHAFATQTVPDGYLICDGSVVSRAEYADLFAALGTVWGEGDGSTTFNVPDLRGEFLRRFDAGRGVDEGRVFASEQNDEFKSHTHGFTETKSALSGSREYPVYSSQVVEPNAVEEAVTHTGGDETRPRNVAVTYAIKAIHPASN